MKYFRRYFKKYSTICLISLKELTMAQVIRKANGWMDRFEMKMGMWAEKIF
jgi:hypothetical protein